MSIIRIKKEQKYFVASNAPFNDSRLSWEARGVMGYLLSKPDGWQCRNYDLEKQSQAGRHVVSRILKELQECGYVHRFRKSKGRGDIEWVTEVYESPDQNPHFSKADFSTIESYDVESYDVEKPVDIVSTDSNKILTRKNTNFNENSKKFSEAEKNRLNHLSPHFRKYAPLHNITSTDELRDAVVFGYQLSKDVCFLDVMGASSKELDALAHTALFVWSQPEGEDKIDQYKEWWYSEYWLGRDKHQPPSPAQIGNTWAQFEAYLQNRSEDTAVRIDGNGFYI